MAAALIFININQTTKRTYPSANARKDAVVLDADKRNGGGAVEHRTASRLRAMAGAPHRGGLGIVLPQTFVFCVIPSNPTVYRLSQLHIHHSPLVFVLKSMNIFFIFIFPHFPHFPDRF